jgi:hypothetical protein
MLSAERCNSVTLLLHTRIRAGYSEEFLSPFSQHPRSRLYGLGVRVPGYRSGSPRFDSRELQEKKVVGLERGPLSLVNTIEELTE